MLEKAELSQQQHQSLFKLARKGFLIRAGK